jgi:hypothetical protein
MQLKLESPWPEFLAAVDQSLTRPVELHCVGGFVLAAVYGIPRMTNDVDYIAIHPDSNEIDEIAGAGSPLHKRHKVYFQRVGVSDFPEDYEDRLTTLPLNLNKLVLKVLDPYDLALSKLTRNSPKDREDVRFLANKLNLKFSILYERWTKEMKTFVANAERHETTLNVVWKDYFLDR